MSIPALFEYFPAPRLHLPFQIRYYCYVTLLKQRHNNPAGIFFFSLKPRNPAGGREEPWYHTSIQPGVFLLLRSSACRSHRRQLYGSASFCLTDVRWTSLLSSSSLVPLFSPLHRAILHSFGIINDNPSVHLSSSKWSVY